MLLFIDTANVEDIRKAAETGSIAGVTTNPTLIAKEGRNFHEVIKEITSIVDGPISAEVTALDAEGMVKEAKELVKIDKNIVIKIPMCIEGLKAVSVLSKENIKTNVTLIFSASQALLAANSGATYVSPFVGRLEDIGMRGLDVVADIAKIFRDYDIKCNIIAASIRNANHVVEAAKAGATIATIPYKVLVEMSKHPLTDRGIDQFVKDWESMKNK